jgi:hypothetical protein
MQRQQAGSDSELPVLVFLPDCPGSHLPLMGATQVWALVWLLAQVAHGTPCTDRSVGVCANADRGACADAWFADRCCASCARLSGPAGATLDDAAAALRTDTVSTQAGAAARSVDQSSIDLSDAFAAAMLEQAAQERAAHAQLDPISRAFVRPRGIPCLVG